MKTKAFEVRDRATFIPVIATKLVGDSEADSYLLFRAGFICHGRTYVLLHVLTSGKSNYDPHEWMGTTIPEAHAYIIKNFDNLQDGDVIDCEFIRGERTEPKLSERLE